MKSIVPGLVTMKANTALALILCSVSLLLFQAERTSLHRRRIAHACALAAAVIGLFTLSEYLFGWNLGIDELLFREAAGAVGTSEPGRMAPTTATNFFLLGIVLLTLESRRKYAFAHFLPVIVAWIGFMALLGYIYEAESLYGIASYTKMAVHTAVAFIALSVGALLARPDRGLAGLVLSEGPGGVVLRRLLLPTIVVFPLLAWLRSEGEQAGLFDTRFGIALVVLAAMTILTALMWGTASWLNHVDAERRQAEDALARERSLLDTFMETTPDHVYFKDEASRFIRISRSLVEWFGPSDPADVIGKTDGDFFSEEHASKALADEQEVMRSGVPLIGIEEKETWPDGRETWVSTTKMPFRNADGRVVGTFGLSRDVTERKQAEDEIRKLNEELERRAAELESQNIELEFQSTELEAQQAQLETVNAELEAQQAELERALGELAEEKQRVDAFYRFSERLTSESELAPLARVVLEEMCDFAQAEIGMLYTLGEERQDVLSLSATRGMAPGSLPAELTLGEGLAGRALSERRTVSLSHGAAGLRLAAFGEDIAVFHELHVPLLQGEQALGALTLARVSDRSFAPEELEAIEHLADHAAAAVANAVSFARTRRQASINRAVLDATQDGIRLVDLEGNNLLANAALEELMSGIPGLPSEGTLYERTDAVAELMTDPASYRAAFAAIAADPDHEAVHEFELAGSKRSLQLYTAPVRDSGELIGRIFIAHEVTAEREAERLKSELVATVSHELRTPLTGVLGFAELLVEHDLDEETRKRYLGTIYSEARRLTALVNDFLDLQRIEEGRFSLTLEPVELGDLLRREVELHSAESAAHALELTLPEEPLVVLGERTRVRLVVGNLLSNAVKYSPGGGPVEVTAQASDGFVRVAVRDSGLGIPVGQQRSLFTKFFRVDSSDTREIGGTGLGLALCREIVEAHGGRIGFESVEGEGSTFWFELPTAQRGNGSGRARVLVIEDDPVSASLLAEYLAADGYAVETAATGEAGLARATSSLPAVVLLDIKLPGELDGWQVLAALKANPQTAHVPVVVCTVGNGRDRATALGASDFLTKPFSSVQLREAVARLLPAGRGSLLVVDDDEAVRRLVVETLGADGFELREAADGQEALAAIAARRPDALVLDLIMPKLDGFAVLERLQADPETRLLPVVVLTGRNLSPEERKKLKRRAVSLLEKSDYSAQELRRLVQQALGQ